MRDGEQATAGLPQSSKDGPDLFSSNKCFHTDTQREALTQVGKLRELEIKSFQLLYQGFFLNKTEINLNVFTNLSTNPSI